LKLRKETLPGIRAAAGITRGKKLVVLIGQRKALGIAVKNNRTENRFSGLLARLTGLG
jgi:ATP-dependent exoDNAse (exonuclease V) alpha subunit